MINLAEGGCIDPDYTYILDLDNKEFRGQGYDLNMSVKLEREELIRYALEWSNGDRDFDYDPEEFLRVKKTMEFYFNLA